MALEITSPAIAPGGEIPARYTCDGEDLSPPLAWSGPPTAERAADLDNVCAPNLLFAIITSKKGAPGCGG